MTGNASARSEVPQAQIAVTSGVGERFLELDALRGFAALAVVLFHYSGHVVRYFGDFPFAFTAGRYGVQLFFVISGYVIFFTLERSRTMSQFAFSRFSRLYPAYWATLITLLAVDILSGKRPIWWGGFVVNSTMLQNFIGYPDLDIVFWSLAVELKFYILIALAAWLGLTRTISLTIAVWLAIGALVSVPGGVIPEAVAGLVSGLLIVQYSPYFAAGIVLRVIHVRGVQIRTMGLGVACVACAYLHGGVTDLLVAIVCIGSMALAVLGRLSWIVSPATIWLGAVSYPLYLIHRNIGYQVLFRLHDAGVPSVISVPVVIAGALIAAAVLTFAIERPARDALRRIAAAHRSWRTRPAA